MDRQKLPPPVSTKITRKLASESTEHNSLLNFYSSISTDETGAPKRWKMSSGVQINEESIASGKLSPVPMKGTPTRDSSSERKGKPAQKRGPKESVEIASSRDSSLENKDKGKIISEIKRDSSSDSSKMKKTEESGKKVKAVDKSKFYGSSPKVNGDTAVKKSKSRPKSLDLNSKLTNGEDESFKSPDPLTPCNVAVKRRKGRPKETPPTLVAESPVDAIEIVSSSMTQTDFDNEELDADIEDNIEPVIVKKKPGRKPKVTTGVISKGIISKGMANSTRKILGQRKIKGRPLVSKLKKSGNKLLHKKVIVSKLSGQTSDPGVQVKRKAGRPPGAKNKTTILKEKLLVQTKEKKVEVDNSGTASLSMECSKTTGESNNEIQASTSEIIGVKRESDVAPVVDKAANFLNTKPKGNKPLRLKKGGVKSLGKLKKEGEDIQKVRKKRILSSYAANSNIGKSLDHLPKNDLRRYLQIKLLERLNGNRSHSHTVLKTLSDEADKSDTDVYSEDDSLPGMDHVNDLDVQNLSALVEQRRVRTESDVSSEQRRSVSRSRKSSVDMSKISDITDNESVCSENSINSSKRIFVLGEDNTESDDTIRTRQRVEIVPGKSRKRTLSGEFDLVDEVQLRKSQKRLARTLGIISFSDSNEVQFKDGVTPAVTPVKVQKKTSPKIAAIKQRLDAKKKISNPFVSEHRKRLLKQSPFLSRMRRKKRSLQGKRCASPVRDKLLELEQNYEVFSTVKVLQEDAIEQNVLDTNALNMDQTEALKSMGINSLTVSTVVDPVYTNQNKFEPSIDVKVGNSEELLESKCFKVTESAPDEVNKNETKQDEVISDKTTDIKSSDKCQENKPFIIELEVNEIIEELISNVIYTCEPELRPSLIINPATQLVIEGSLMNVNQMDNLPCKLEGKRKPGRPGRPKKAKKHFGATKKLPQKPGQSTYTGARRGRKPKSANQVKESPMESTVVRKFELRQKISRSPLDNIALKQSLEENEYYKNEAQRVNRKEAKEAKQKSKRDYALAAEGQTIYPYEPMPEIPVTAELLKTETATESEFSDGDEDLIEAKPVEDYLSECKPCSVVLLDFIKQLQRAQQKAAESCEEESATETEDSQDDSIDYSEGTLTADTSTVEEKAASPQSKLLNDGTGNDQPLTSIDNASVVNLSPFSSDKKHEMPEETPNKSQTKELNISPISNKIKVKTPPSRKKPLISKSVKKITPEHQTARKTVPPLKIKLKGGIKKKMYMVESPLQDYETQLNPPTLEKRAKKKKSKSSSKSGSDSDRGNRHHHHHKKRNKSPLAGQIGPFGEKKSKPTAIVAASPSIKPSPVPKGQFEATFLEFIQNKDKDIAPLPKVKPYFDVMNMKEYKVDNEGSLIVTASAKSPTNLNALSTTTSITNSNSEASLYNSISINTSLVNSVINENVQKALEMNSDNNQKKDNQLFIGVIGSRSNLQYFCSICEKEVHKTDDIVLKHFASVHPGQPIMYRRVADTQQKESSSNIFEKLANLVGPGQPAMNVTSNENSALTSESNLSAGNQEAVPSQINGTSQSSVQSYEQPVMDNQSMHDGEEDDQSDTGSLNLKIVEVVSLQDQLHSIDQDDIPHEGEHPTKLPTQYEASFTNSVYTPELKIPHFPRSTNSASITQELSEQSKQQFQDKSKVQATLSPMPRPHQRKTPGILTPGKLCNTFKCEKCNVHAPVLAAMVAHLRNSHTDIPRLFQCPYCRDKEAESEAQIHQHIRKYHPTDNPNPPVALSERAKGNLRTLSVRVPDNKASDSSFLEKDIYMCLNCKIHMPSLEAIYDHLEHIHTEVFVFVCSACKVFKSKTEQVVLQHIQSEPRCNTMEKNISLAIDGNQFTRVPCLIKEKNKSKEKNTTQPKVTLSPIQPSVSKHIQSNSNTFSSSSIVQALQKQNFSQAQLNRPGFPMQQMFQHPFAQLLGPPVGAPHFVTQTVMTPHLVTQQPVTAKTIIPQQQQQRLLVPISTPHSMPMASISIPQSMSMAPISIPQSMSMAPISIPQSMSMAPTSIPQSMPMASISIPQSMAVAPIAPAVTSLSSTTSTISTSAPSSISSSSSDPVGSAKPVAPAVPTKPTGAKKRKNLLESIQHIKMQKQIQQQVQNDPSESGPLATLSSSSSVSDSSASSHAPPPLIRGPPPLIRFDQINQGPLSVTGQIQPETFPLQILQQVSTPLQLPRSDGTKSTVPPRQIKSSLFDTSDPEAFRPIQRTPVLNVPSVPRSNRTQLPGSKSSQQKPSSAGSAPLDLSRTTPTHSPASTPPVTEKISTQNNLDITNPDVYNVFNLKPSTQAQLPKQALQNKVALHQLPPKAPGPPQTVRPNMANTLAYRPQHPHVSTAQVPQVINMPLGMLNTMGNIVVTMPSFQVVQGMPAQYIRMSGPTGPVSVAVAMPTGQAARPVLTSPQQQGVIRQPMNVNLPVFKCPYCPKLIPLTFVQVQPHIETQHPGCSVVFMPIENKKS